MKESVQVKICGITNEADAFAAVQAGAQYLGYILNYPDSPRYMRIEQVSKIISIVRKIYPQVQHVGVFVDAKEETIGMVLDKTDIDIVQLHGMESSQLVTQLQSQGIAVWKVIELREQADVERVEEYRGMADCVLVDAGKGTGRQIDPELLQQIEFDDKTILAGGLRPENVSEIVQQYHPMIIDVSSGVESVPGKKDQSKLQMLFSNAQV